MPFQSSRLSAASPLPILRAGNCVIPREINFLYAVCAAIQKICAYSVEDEDYQRYEDCYLPAVKCYFTSRRIQPRRTDKLLSFSHAKSRNFFTFGFDLRHNKKQRPSSLYLFFMMFSLSEKCRLLSAF